MTTVRDGLYQWGGAPVGGMSRFAGLWRGRTFYVDGTSGVLGNNALTPRRATTTLARAVALAGTDDTIYIRPQAVGVRYTENVVVPVTTHGGLSIIGTGNGRGNSVYQACSFKGATSVDSPILDLDSSYANVENLHFWSNAAQLVVGMIRMRWNTGGGLNIGSSIINCSFSENPDSVAAAGVLQSYIRMDSTEGQLVQGCMFENARIAISLHSTASACYSIKILNNNFGGLAAAVAADIAMTDATIVDINDNTFNHGVPTQAAAYQKYIFVVSTGTGGMARNYQAASAVAKGTNNTATNILAAGNFGLGGPWTS